MRSQYLLKSRNKALELGTRTCIMGVVNITPDSFYDGGAHFKPEVVSWKKAPIFWILVDNQLVPDLNP
jgi:hypothetical protein